MSGWIKLHRKLSDNNLWKSEPFTRGQAWVDLILIANHKSGFIFVRGNKVDIKRGQVGWSILALSKRWKWSRGKIKRFISVLEREQQVIQQNNKISSIITIVNYDEYQKADTKEDNRRTTDGQQTDTNKNDKKNKKNKNIPDFEKSGEEFYLTKKGKKLSGKRLETFNEFWKCFNYKKGKAEAADAWLSIPELTNSLVQNIYSSAKIEADNRSTLISSGKIPKWAQGWLTGRRWEDEQEINNYSQDESCDLPEIK